MKNRVCVKETKFHIDETNKVVICILDVDLQLSNHPSWEVIFTQSWRHMPYIKGYGEFEAKGIARCNSDDIFDVERGKRIAESRAKAKAFDIASKVYLAIDNSLDKYKKAIESTLGACLIAKEVEEAHIEKLID